MDIQRWHGTYMKKPRRFLPYRARLKGDIIYNKYKSHIHAIMVATPFSISD
jgi:hypothetical protein